MKIEKLVFSPIMVNTYILSDETNDCAILDCGCFDDNEFNELKEFLLSKNLKPQILLNTHLHLDHIFGNRYMNEEYGLRTHASREDEMNLTDAPKHANRFGMSIPDPPSIGKYIKDNDEIEFGNTRLRCLFVPGHTSGSIAFLNEADKTVITGDVLFAGSIGRTDLPGGDYDLLIKSIKERLLCLDDDVVIYPGHGPATTIGEERKNNPFIS